MIVNIVARIQAMRSCFIFSFFLYHIYQPSPRAVCPGVQRADTPLKCQVNSGFDKEWQQTAEISA